MSMKPTPENVAIVRSRIQSIIDARGLKSVKFWHGKRDGDPIKVEPERGGLYGICFIDEGDGVRCSISSSSTPEVQYANGGGWFPKMEGEHVSVKWTHQFADTADCKEAKLRIGTHYQRTIDLPDRAGTDPKVIAKKLEETIVHVREVGAKILRLQKMALEAGLVPSPRYYEMHAAPTAAKARKDWSPSIVLEVDCGMGSKTTEWVVTAYPNEVDDRGCRQGKRTRFCQSEFEAAAQAWLEAAKNFKPVPRKKR